MGPNLDWQRFGWDMVGRQGRAGAEDSARAWLEDLAEFDRWTWPEELGCEMQLGTTELKDSDAWRMRSGLVREIRGLRDS